MKINFVNRRRKRRLQEENDIIEGEIQEGSYNSVITRHKRKKAIKEAFVSSFTVIVIVGYILLGVFLDMWHPGWLIFLLIPIFSSLVWAIIEKNPSYFSIEMVAIATYVSIGIIMPNNTGWHPYWAILLVIPVYRSIISAVTKVKYLKN
jgi:hypothetical protein